MTAVELEIERKNVSEMAQRTIKSIDLPTLEKLKKYLAKLTVAKNPLQFSLEEMNAQWEGLFHIHRFMLLDDKSNSTKKVFDRSLTYKKTNMPIVFSCECSFYNR